MNRRSFLQVTVPSGIGLASGISRGAPAAEDNRWTLANSRLKIELAESSKGGLSGFIDLKSQRNFIAKTGPLYRLTLVQKGQAPLELSSADAESLKVERSSADNRETLTLTYGRHRDRDLTVICRVQLEADSPLSQWRFSVKNNTPYSIPAVRYPLVQAPRVLGDSSKDDCFVQPAGGGELITDPVGAKHFHYTGKPVGVDRRCLYPQYAALQMQAFYDDTAGIYLAAYDSGLNVKHFGLKDLKDALDISIEHNYDERPMVSYELPYVTVLGVFQGDWYTAADLYRDWARDQPWCEKRKSERRDLPSWLTEPRPTLQYECRGDMQRCRGLTNYPPSDYPFGKFYPAKKVVPLTRRYSEIFDTPTIVWYNGWEKNGNPSGPVDSLPPREGAESLRAAMVGIAADGHVPYMAVWGNHWVYKRRGAGFDGTELFEHEGVPLAAIDQKGEIPRQGTAEYTYAPLCNGSDKVHDVFVKYFGQILDLGAVAMEFDHQASPSICYSDQHDHAPGLGGWMGEKTTELLRKLRRVIKQRNATGAFSFEGVVEPWIQDMDFMLFRPYMPGSLPLFTYVYHEYITMMGGDGPFGVTHVEEQLMQHATNFVYGHTSFVMVGLNDFDFEADPTYPIFTLLRNICHAQRSYAREYVVFGKMLRPTRNTTATISAPPWYTWEEPDPPATVVVPKVVHSVWESGGKIGYLLANWSGAPENVKLELVKKTGAVAVISNGGKSSADETQVATGELAITVPARGIVLVEQS